MTSPVWLIDLRGEAELPNGSSSLDGIVVRPSDHEVLGIGIRTGFLSKRTVWTTIDRLIRANGSRAWLSANLAALSERPPDGVWLRADLSIRHGTVTLGTIGWAGVSGATVVELGVVPLDPRMQPRIISANSVTTLNDRSVVVDVADFETAPLLKTDREIEDDIRSRLWDVRGPLPSEALDRITVAVGGGVAALGGLVPRDRHRALAFTIAQEPLEVRGVVNHIESAESLTASAAEFRA